MCTKMAAVSHGSKHVTTKQHCRHCVDNLKGGGGGRKKELHTTAQRVCVEADTSAVVAIVKRLGLISRSDVWQVFI